MARKCIVCGKEYSYCRSCSKDAKKETWYALYDNENCKNISQALTDYDFNRITQEEAKELLSKCDLSIKVREYYQNILETIMAKPKRGLRAKMPVIDEVIPVEVIPEVVEVVEEIIEEAIEEPNGVVIEE